MKVGIITIIGNDNYGNRLQNYALQNVLEELKIDVKTLRNEPYSNTKKGYILRILKNLKNRGTYSENKDRKKNFCNFNKNIKFYNKKINAFTKYDDFDYVIVGSDQVWNPTFSRLRDVDLLVNVNPEKRISYSASFGIAELPSNLIPKVSKELKKFKAISVREDTGKKIIESITKRKDVQVVLDPTMLVERKKWEEISIKPKMLKNKKYILNYFLGEMSEKIKKEINQIAYENNCEVINLLDKDSLYYNCGPSEFLYLEKNAFLICTDSFHSTVFAILFNKKFVVFDRNQKNLKNMNSRLDTLLSKFKLDNRKYNGKIELNNLDLNCDEINEILKLEKESSIKFLINALDIKEEN